MNSFTPLSVVKKRKKSFVSTSLKIHLEDYCRSTSIHGIKYLGEKDRLLGEKLWWLLAFVVCIFGNGYLIGQVWNKWNDSPVIVSFAETTTPVWQIPFPAITICSEQKIKASLFSHFSSDVDESEEINEKKEYLKLLCNNLLNLGVKKFANESLVSFFKEVAPSLDELFYYVKWNKKIAISHRLPINDLFSTTISEKGVCYTFNMLSPSELFRGNGYIEKLNIGINTFLIRIPLYAEHNKSTNGQWTLDGGYLKDATLENVYPERALFSGIKAGILMVLGARTSDSICEAPLEGFRVLLHNPAEIPSIEEQYHRVPLAQEVILTVKPKIMTTSRGLRSYSPHRRHCYFSDERYLKHFKIYTQKNCELECLTNYTLKKCDCVGFYMPRENNVKICLTAKQECMSQANRFLRMSEIKSKYKGDNSESCDCLPTCTSLEYDAEISQGDFIVEDGIHEKSGLKYARLTVFFKNTEFITSKRSELFGLVDFMANCGGLLGLFCGVSLLSLVEIVYYMTLRFWSNMKKLRENEKQHENNIYSKKKILIMHNN